jgi:hypothetical protein
MRFNILHLKNMEEIRKTRVNPKTFITCRRVQTPKTPMLWGGGGGGTKERKNILAWYIRRTTSPKTTLAFLKFINTSSERDILPN